MKNIKTVLTTKGEEVSYFDEIITSGTMKDVYLATDNQSVVAFYREPLDSVGVFSHPNCETVKKLIYFFLVPKFYLGMVDGIYFQTTYTNPNTVWVRENLIS